MTSEERGENDKPIKRIVIVGGGSAGWMTAALMSKFFGGFYNIELIESEEIGTIGVGEATIPSIKLFNSLLEIDERHFMRKTMGTFKLGIEFVDWGAHGQSYVHGFGKLGWDINWIHMYQYWLKANASGRAGTLDQYSVNTLACRENKFSHTNSATAGDPQGDIAYAYHFDASLYAALLKEEAERRGVRRTEGTITHASLRPDDGFIKAVHLNNGAEITGDLFIDCSGVRALLIGETLGSSYESWSHWLFSDRALAVQSENTGVLTPYTRSTAYASGWQWRIPLQHRTGNGMVYSSEHMSDDEAGVSLRTNVTGNLLAEPRLIKFKPGRRRESWVKNCVAVGLSSGFLEPLESTSIHLIQTAIMRIIAMFPSQRFDQIEIDEYNRHTQHEFDRVRDFIIAHYKVTQRGDSPMWRRYQAMDIPETLKMRLDHFGNNGKLHKLNEGLFGEGSWVQVLIGQGLIPRRYDVNVDMQPEHKIENYLNGVREHVRALVRKMPDAGRYLQSHCGVAVSQSL